MGLAAVTATSFFLLRSVDHLRNKLTFVPTKGTPISIAFRRVVPQDVFLLTPDNEKLHAWFLQQQAKIDHEKESPRLVLYFHGNGGNLGSYVHSLEELYSLGYDVLAVDYRGYGLSSGTPDEQGVLTDAQAVFQYAIQVLHYSEKRILFYGFSMGTVPASWLGQKYPNVAGVILQNAFTNLFEVAKANQMTTCTSLIGTLESTVSTLFCPLTYAQYLYCPVLIVHSKQDELCPYQHGDTIYRKIPHSRKKFISLPGSHSNFDFSQDFRDSMKNFF